MPYYYCYLLLILLCIMNEISCYLNLKGKIGIIIIDHGSRKNEANLGLLEIVNKFRTNSEYEIVEGAHMELAEPSIKTAYRKCIEQGATRIVCHPYFLSKGRHVQEDIPSLVKEASLEYPDINYIITYPVGESYGIIDLIKGSVESTINDYIINNKDTSLNR